MLQQGNLWNMPSEHKQRSMTLDRVLKLCILVQCFLLALALAFENDDFCDDLALGTDENRSAACTFLQVKRSFICTGDVESSIPLSRIGDNVCDCCDGSDELEGICRNTCEVELASRRERHEVALAAYKHGAAACANLELTVEHEQNQIAQEAVTLKAEVEALRLKMSELQIVHDDATRTQKEQLHIIRQSTYAQIYTVLGLGGELSEVAAEQLVHSLHKVLGVSASEAERINREAEALKINSSTVTHEKSIAEEEGNDADAESSRSQEDSFIQEMDINEAGDSLAPTDISVTAGIDPLESAPVQVLTNLQPKHYLPYIIEKRKPFSQVQSLLAYYYLHSSFGSDAETFAQIYNEASKASHTCVEAYTEITDPQMLEKYCSIYSTLQSLVEDIEAVAAADNAIALELEAAKGDLEQKSDMLSSVTTAQERYHVYLGTKTTAFLGLKGECAKFVHGKYEYSVCFDRDVTQKDMESHGATRLGGFSNAEVDEEGKTALHFTDGAHCWNHGPRVATVFVTCGEFTKILSAHEPSTCVYEIDMESPAACNAIWAKKWGL